MRFFHLHIQEIYEFLAPYYILEFDIFSHPPHKTWLFCGIKGRYMILVRCKRYCHLSFNRFEPTKSDIISIQIGNKERLYHRAVSSSRYLRFWRSYLSYSVILTRPVRLKIVCIPLETISFQHHPSPHRQDFVEIPKRHFILHGNYDQPWIVSVERSWLWQSCNPSRVNRVSP